MRPPPLLPGGERGGGGRRINPMRTTRWIVFALALALLLPLPAEAQKVSLVFSAGPTGGTWTPMAAATAEGIKKRFPEVDVQVEPGAALVNMEKMRNGKAVARPPRGNTSLAEGWELLLKAYGMKLDDLGTKSFGSLTENGELIKNRQAVAMGWFTTVPASFVLDVGSARKLRMIPVPEDIIKKMQGFNAGFVRHVVPKGTYTAYGFDEDLLTIQSPTILIASSKAPVEAIYKVTKAIIEGREHFGNVTASMKGIAAKEMAQNFGMPYHPGAEKYYREAGLLK